MSSLDAVSSPFGKGKQLALKFLEVDIAGQIVLRQPGVTHAQFKATADNLFLTSSEGLDRIEIDAFSLLTQL